MHERLAVRVKGILGEQADIVVSGLPAATEIMNVITASGGAAKVVHGRLVTTGSRAALTAAAEAVGGKELADVFRSRIVTAVRGWQKGPGDIDLGDSVLPTSRRPIVMGVLNVTPDSFSDGGLHWPSSGESGRRAIEAAQGLLAAGADIVDVGGESTRPGAKPVTAEEELRRTIPVIEALAAQGGVVSIDTSKGRVARAAVRAGASLVNDVTAGTADESLLPTVAELAVPYVLMHMQGTPQTMQESPQYLDVVAEVFDQLSTDLTRLDRMGIARDRIMLDPGIGFGKNLDHNIDLLRKLREFTSLRRPILVGVSRKSFIGTLTGQTSPSERLEGSLAGAAIAVSSGARVLRVHDVQETVRAVRVAHSIGNPWGS